MSPSRRGGYSRYNFYAFLADMVSFFGASALLSPVTILPLFANELSSRPEVIGLIPTLSSLGMTLPQIVGARLVAHRTRYRPFVMRWAIVERASVLCAVLGLALLARAPAMLLLWVPMGFLFLWWGSMGVNGPAYTAMLGHAIPPERRGILFGTGAFLGGGVGFAFAWIARYLIATLAFPYGFAACAGMAFALLVAGVTPLAFVRERPGPPPEELAPESGRTLDILRTDAPFRRYLLSQIVYSMQAMPTAIWTTYALKRLSARPEDVPVITAVIAIAGGVAYLAAGWLADRHGNRAVLLWSTLLSAFAALAAWLAPNLPVYILTFIPASFAMSGWGLTSFNILMEFAPHGRVPSYSAANALVAGPFRVAAPLLGSVLVDRTGWYGLLFLLAALAALAATGVLAFVPEPRWNGTAPALEATGEAEV